MKFKVGDKVKVIKCKHHLHCENINKISKIKKIETFVTYPYYLEDCDEPFDGEELELVENQFTKADLKDGDKCTLRNGQVVFVDKTSQYCFENIDEQLKYFNDDVSIVKVERPVKYETLFARKEEILDETEKRYLANVIRPFRDNVEGIKKGSYAREFIKIYIKEDEPIVLPYFEKGTMYKGMKEHKKYTLKELGI